MLLLALTGWRAQKQPGATLPLESSSQGEPHSPAHPSVKREVLGGRQGRCHTVECESGMRGLQGQAEMDVSGARWAGLQSPTDPAPATVRAAGGLEPPFLMSSPSPASFPVTPATPWSLRSLAQAFPGARLREGPCSGGGDCGASVRTPAGNPGPPPNCCSTISLTGLRFPFTGGL